MQKKLGLPKALPNISWNEVVTGKNGSYKQSSLISHSCAIPVKSTESTDYEKKAPNHSFCLTLFQLNIWEILKSLAMKQLYFPKPQTKLSKVFVVVQTRREVLQKEQL